MVMWLCKIDHDKINDKNKVYTRTPDNKGRGLIGILTKMGKFEQNVRSESRQKWVPESLMWDHVSRQNSCLLIMSGANPDKKCMWLWPFWSNFKGSIPVNYGQFIEHEWIQARKKFMANTLPAFVEVCSCRETNQTSAFCWILAVSSIGKLNRIGKDYIITIRICTVVVVLFFTRLQGARPALAKREIYWYLPNRVR